MIQFNFCCLCPAVLRERGINCYEILVHGVKPLCDSDWTKFFLVVLPGPN